MVDLSAYKGLEPVEIVGGHAMPAIGDLPYFFTLGPHGFYWLRLVPAPRPAV
jgi:maltose alpha-D-glucosyltransferase/alpha-amylase